MLAQHLKQNYNIWQNRLYGLMISNKLSHCICYIIVKAKSTFWYNSVKLMLLILLFMYGNHCHVRPVILSQGKRWMQMWQCQVCSVPRVYDAAHWHSERRWKDARVYVGHLLFPLLSWRCISVDHPRLWWCTDALRCLMVGGKPFCRESLCKLRRRFDHLLLFFRQSRMENHFPVWTCTHVHCVCVWYHRVSYTLYVGRAGTVT